MSFLVATAVDDGGLDSGADGAGGGTESLDLLDNVQGLSISDLAEDDVLAIEPRGDNGGDEELGAVAGKKKGMFSMALYVDQPGYKSETLRLTCWGQRWPWTEDQGGCACGRSSHRGTSHRRWSDHRYPIPVKKNQSQIPSIAAIIRIRKRKKLTLPRVKSPP